METLYQGDNKELTNSFSPHVVENNPMSTEGSHTRLMFTSVYVGNLLSAQNVTLHYLRYKPWTLSVLVTVKTFTFSPVYHHV